MFCIVAVLQVLRCFLFPKWFDEWWWEEGCWRLEPFLHDHSSMRSFPVWCGLCCSCRASVSPVCLLQQLRSDLELFFAKCCTFREAWLLFYKILVYFVVLARPLNFWASAMFQCISKHKTSSINRLFCTRPGKSFILCSQSTLQGDAPSSVILFTVISPYMYFFIRLSDFFVCVISQVFVQVKIISMCL